MSDYRDLSEYAVVDGAFVTLKTMADGTPRITIDLACSLSDVAKMGFQPGTPLAIAVLTQPAAQEAMQKKAAEPEMKGGELAKWAGILCADKYFWAWLTEIHSYFDMMYGLGGMEERAKQFIYLQCGIQSRRELDHNNKAGRIFREEIMKPFHEWRERQ